MGDVLYDTVLGDLGPEVGEFLEEGLVILFAKGAPPELREVSVDHEPTAAAAETAPVAGDVLAIDDTEFTVTAVGPKAWQTMHELGHATFKFNGETEAELPGEICVQSPEGVSLAEIIRSGARFVLRSGSGSEEER